MNNKEKPKYKMRQVLGFMLKRAWHSQKSVLFLGAAFAALLVTQNVVQLLLAPSILRIVENRGSISLLLGTIGCFTIMLVILSGLREYADRNMMYGRIKVRFDIGLDMNDKACTTSYPNFQNPEIKKLYDRASQTGFNNDEAQEHIFITLQELLLNAAGFALYLLLLSGLNPVLLIVVVLTSAISFFVNRRCDRWKYEHRHEVDEQLTHLAYLRRTMELPEISKDIRIFGLGSWLKALRKKSFDAFDALLARRDKSAFFAAAVELVMAFMRSGIAYVYLIHLLLTTGMPVSEFLLYFSAFSGFSAWVTGILTTCSDLHKETLDLSSVMEYLNLPEPFRFEEGKAVPKADRWELRMEHVSFRYPGSEKEIIHNMDLTLHSGEKLAIVGLNGAGKTTLVKLLCGLYDPSEGRITLNGQDIREFDRRSYYKLFSAVFQDFSMPDLTVAETVAQDYENIDVNRVNECLEKAGLTQMVQNLPKGLDTHLGKEIFLDGVRLSGGQTQRMMLARALYKDGPFLVLDEPTAALDPLAENDIYQKYSQMTDGKTSVFISHRLASTRFCDRILFLENGCIKEEGTHEQLLARGGGYAKLFDVQARYYQEGRAFA